MSKLGSRGRAIARKLSKRGWKWFRTAFKGTKHSGLRKLYLPYAIAALRRKRHLR